MLTNMSGEQVHALTSCWDALGVVMLEQVGSSSGGEGEL